MNFNIPPSQIVGTFTDSYDPNSYRTKYDIAMNQKFCCSVSKESYKYTVNSTSDDVPIKRQIIFNSTNQTLPYNGIQVTGGGPAIVIDGKRQSNDFDITITNESIPITYYNDIQIIVTFPMWQSFFRFKIENGIPDESIISVGDKNCLYITQKGNTTYVDFDKCCYQG